MESLLVQTFQNFEVIVVDDCSTDNSVAVVQSYAEKFGGRFKLARMKKNTGTGGFPRNKGMKLSRGEYIYFMDADDFITPTALEELYTLAKNFDADIVHCENYYQAPNEILNNAERRKNLKPRNQFNGEKFLVTEPLVWENNFEERIKFFSRMKLIWSVWNQLIRRDFIMGNKLQFWDLHCDDMLFIFCELCCAKKYIVVPNTIYYYRLSENSVMRRKKDSSQLLRQQVKALKTGIRYIDEFLSSREFFLRRPDLKYILFDAFAVMMMSSLDDIYARVPAHALDDLLQKEFSDGNHKALTTLLFSMVNSYRRDWKREQKRIALLEDEIRRLKG